MDQDYLRKFVLCVIILVRKLWCEYRANQHRWIEDTEENAGHCIRQA